MVVKVIAKDGAHVEVVDRGPGIEEREVQRICRWVASHFGRAQAGGRVGDFVLARRAPGAHGGDCFTFVASEE